MIWTLIGVALAGAPSVLLLEDGSIVGTVTVRAPVEVARSRVSDPFWVASTDAGTRVTVRARDGACLLMDAVSTSVVVDVKYTTRQCPTADGVLATLVSSDTLTAYTSSWRVSPAGTGSRIEYRFSMQTSLPLPQSFISGATRARVQAMMGKMGEALDGEA